MKNLLILVSVFFFFKLQSQTFPISQNNNAQQLAQALAGSGVSISNVTLNCAPTGTATFSNAPGLLGINQGIILSTGRATDIAQAPAQFASTNNGRPGDTDLNNYIQTLGANFQTFDACALEFDITVTGNFISFNYAMGSEEYPTFVCDIFNDIFAFFITGPNPAGGNYNNQNIALIPNSTTPVSINTVNAGNIFFPISPFCVQTNQQFFAGQIPNIVFGGNTRVLTASAATVPCATYRFKLVIADGGDAIYDSGVFIEAGSFTSNSVSISSTAGGISGDTLLVEGCTTGQFIFELIDAQGGDSTLNLIIEGTAINGVDYELIPTVVDFSGGTGIVAIDIIPIEDGIFEGIESIIIYAAGACPGEFTDSAIIFIADRIPLTVNPVVDSLCIGESITVTASGAETYLWSPPAGIPNPTSPTVVLSPDTNTIYTLTYTLGTCTDDTIVDISVINLQLIDNFVVDESCPNAADGFIEIIIANNLGNNVTYLWSDGQTTNTAIGLTAGEYSVIVEEGGCEFEFFFNINSPLLFLNVSASDTVICIGDSIQFFFETNLQNNTTYEWTPSTGISNVNNPLTSASPQQSVTYTLSGTNAAGCEISDSITITVQQLQVNALFSDTAIVPGESIELGVVVDSVDLTNPIQFSWTPETFLSNPTIENPIATPPGNVIYTLTATSGDCSDTTTTSIFVDIVFNMPNAFSPNNDGINDVFYPENLAGGTVREFRIYNQWGQMIYNDPSQGWNGFYNGVLQSPGLYFYYIRISNGNTEEILSGELYLVL